MPSIRGGSKSLSGWRRGLLIGSFASLVYAGIVTIYSILSPSVSLSGSLGAAFGISTLFALGSIGLPILFWIRYDIRSPVVLMVLILLFWHVIVHLPILGSEGGDAPAFTLVLFWAPFYVVAYGILAGGEYWLRRRNIRIQTLGS